MVRVAVRQIQPFLESTAKKNRQYRKDKCPLRCCRKRLQTQYYEGWYQWKTMTAAGTLQGCDIIIPKRSTEVFKWILHLPVHYIYIYILYCFSSFHNKAHHSGICLVPVSRCRFCVPSSLSAVYFSASLFTFQGLPSRSTHVASICSPHLFWNAFRFLTCPEQKVL